jgi:HlyD family secretion protein
VAALLDPAQKKTFAAINAEIDARRQAAQAERAAGASATPSAAAPSSGSGASSGASSGTAPSAAATAGAAASAGSAVAGAASASPSAAAPKSDAKPSTPAASGTSSAGPTGGTTGGGGPLRAFRDRLERDLAFTESQRGQLDGIFSAMRERFATVREAPEADRPKLMETYRAELRARINDILDETQKKKYAEILVELAGRSVSRGRVFILGPDGKPMALELRLGLSDGVATEVIGTSGERKLVEGDLVYTGVVGAPTAKPGTPSTPMRPAGPRL